MRLITNFAASEWSFKTAMLKTFFADSASQQHGFVKAFDDQVDQFQLGRDGRLSPIDSELFYAINRYLKGLDPEFDIGSQVLPAIVWLRLAFRYWLSFGGSSGTCLALYEKWRTAKQRNGRLCLVAPKHVALKIRSGEFYGEDLRIDHSCYSLDVFLSAEKLRLEGLAVPWRVVVVEPESHHQARHETTTSVQRRSYEASVGVGRYHHAKEVIRAAAESGALGRKLSQKIDQTTQRYLYEGRRQDLRDDLRKKGFEIAAGPDLTLKLISRFVQCRKASVSSRK